MALELLKYSIKFNTRAKKIGPRQLKVDQGLGEVDRSTTFIL